MSQLTPSQLRFFEPLDTLTADNLNEIAQKLTVLDIRKGDNIFIQGNSINDHFFLLEGAVEINIGSQGSRQVQAGSDEAKLALVHIIPRNCNVTARTRVKIICIDSDLLDMMLTWNQASSFQVEELVNDDDDWMTRLLSSEVFRRIPPANIQAVFTSLEDIEVKPGDAIVRQNEPGDYFYIIKSGRCMVTRRMPGSDKEIKLAELNAGRSFGEEALISDAPRNATVVMLTRGVLSRLSKTQFLELMNAPMQNLTGFTAAKNEIEKGEAKWLDVRLPAEYNSAHIKGSQHLPLIFLRMKMKELDKSQHYIVYCDTGRRSSSASFILGENGFSVSILENGLKDVDTSELEGRNVC